MRLIDINGKERDVESFKRIHYAHVDKDGKSVDAEYAEVVIHGRTRSWMEWWPIGEFERLNPGVDI